MGGGTKIWGPPLWNLVLGATIPERSTQAALHTYLRVKSHWTQWDLGAVATHMKIRRLAVWDPSPAILNKLACQPPPLQYHLTSPFWISMLYHSSISLALQTVSSVFFELKKRTFEFHSTVAYFFKTIYLIQVTRPGLCIIHAVKKSIVLFWNFVSEKQSQAGYIGKESQFKNNSPPGCIFCVLYCCVFFKS